MKKDFVMPILVLGLICLLMTGALVAVNTVTQPVIREAAAQRADTARKEVIPQADGFVLLEADGLPKSIKEIYGTNNDTGYIFVIETVGYGGEMTLMCAIGPDGTIIKTMTLAEMETKGIATPVFDMESDYIGKDRNLEGIDTVSGATITSKAYMGGVRDAFEAFELIMGGLML